MGPPTPDLDSWPGRPGSESPASDRDGHRATASLTRSDRVRPCYAAAAASRRPGRAGHGSSDGPALRRDAGSRCQSVTGPPPGCSRGRARATAAAGAIRRGPAGWPARCARSDGHGGPGRGRATGPGGAAAAAARPVTVTGTPVTARRPGPGAATSLRPSDKASARSGCQPCHTVAEYHGSRLRAGQPCRYYYGVRGSAQRPGPPRPPGRRRSTPSQDAPVECIAWS
jgi:hypothetical protein